MKSIAKKLIVMLLAFLMIIAPMVSMIGCSKKEKGTTKSAKEAVEEFEDTEAEEDVSQSEDFEF